MFCVSWLNMWNNISLHILCQQHPISCNDKECFYWSILCEDLLYEKHDDILIHNIIIWNNKPKEYINIKILNYSTNYFYNKFVMDKQK